MDRLGKILIVDDNQDVLFSLNVLLDPFAEKIIVATDPEKVIPFMKIHTPDIILLSEHFLNMYANCSMPWKGRSS